MSMPWLRLYVDFLDDAKMLSLSFEEQRHYLCLLMVKASGVMDQAADVTTLDRIVAHRLWVTPEQAKEIKERLVGLRLISDKWQPCGWEKRQRQSDVDRTNSERQKKHRNALRNADRNGDRNGSNNADSNGDGVSLRNGDRNAQVTGLDKNRIDKTREEYTHTRATSSLVSDDFIPSDDTLTRLKMNGKRSPESPDLVKFIAYHKSNGTLSDDWQSAFVYWWMRESTGQKNKPKDARFDPSRFQV